MLKAMEINKDVVTSRVASALHKHVGRGKEYSYEDFARLVGEEKRTIESWVRGEACPPTCKILRCASVLPANFINSVLEIAGLHGAYEVGDTCDSRALNHKAAQLTAMISGHMLDGKVDHLEIAEQVPQVRELHAMCGRFLNGVKGQ